MNNTEKHWEAGCLPEGHRAPGEDRSKGRGRKQQQRSQSLEKRDAVLCTQCGNRGTAVRDELMPAHNSSVQQGRR